MAAPDAIALLKADHRAVEALFEDFKKARGALMRSCFPMIAIRIATFGGMARASRTISRPDASPMLT